MKIHTKKFLFTIYYSGYVTIKKDLKSYSVNPLYLIFNKVNGYFKKMNGNQHLMLVPTREREDKIKKYGELWNKIRDLIRSITKNSDDYDKRYMKIKFNSDNKLPLNKMVETPTITIVVRNIFLENNKYYLQVFLDECLYKILKCYIMIELTFLEKSMLIKQLHQKSLMFVTIVIS